MFHEIITFLLLHNLDSQKILEQILCRSFQKISIKNLMNLKI